MKLKYGWVLALLLAACGDGDDGDKKTTEQRILAAGTAFSGSVDGHDNYVFDDGSKVKLVVSGRMAVETPEGVVLSSDFPAEVTFSVRSASGQLLTGRAAFASIVIDAQARFRGETAVSGGTAVISGAFVTVTDATILDVQGFSFPQPATGGVKSREIVLQGSRLTETRLTPAP